MSTNFSTKKYDNLWKKGVKGDLKFFNTIFYLSILPSDEGLVVFRAAVRSWEDTGSVRNNSCTSAWTLDPWFWIVFILFICAVCVLLCLLFIRGAGSGNLGTDPASLKMKIYKNLTKNENEGNNAVETPIWWH